MDRCGVSTSDTIDPLHDERGGAREVLPHPGDLDIWVAPEIVVKVLDICGL